MMDTYGTGIAAGYGGLQGAGQNACVGNQIIPVVTSLEQRLVYLTNGVERVMKIRQSLEIMADNLSSDPRTSDSAKGCPPPATDLSGKFGDAIGYLHTNVDEIERLVHRMRNALFDEKKAACVPEGRRG